MAAHLPAWLEAAASIVIERYEAEAVFLIGSQARGDARPGSDYNLFAFVPHEALRAPRLVVEARRATLDGFPRPVTLLMATLAECSAGVYAGHPAWTALAREAHPLVDPLDCAARLTAQLVNAPVPLPGRMTMPLRPAIEADLDTIIELIHALAEYEREPDAVRLDRETLRGHLFGPRPYAEVILAETPAGASAGFALFFHNFSTWVGRPGIWLEDLFVRPEYRGHGYGRALLTELGRLAVERGCGRLEWSVLDWNEPSIAFYRALGAEAMDEWTTYRITGPALERLAGDAPSA